MSPPPDGAAMWDEDEGLDDEEDDPEEEDWEESDYELSEGSSEDDVPLLCWPDPFDEGTEASSPPRSRQNSRGSIEELRQEDTLDDDLLPRPGLLEDTELEEPPASPEATDREHRSDLDEVPADQEGAAPPSGSTDETKEAGFSECAEEPIQDDAAPSNADEPMVDEAVIQAQNLELARSRARELLQQITQQALLKVTAEERNVAVAAQKRSSAGKCRKPTLEVPGLSRPRLICPRRPSLRPRPPQTKPERRPAQRGCVSRSPVGQAASPHSASSRLSLSFDEAANPCYEVSEEEFQRLLQLGAVSDGQTFAGGTCYEISEEDFRRLEEAGELQPTKVLPPSPASSSTDPRPSPRHSRGAPSTAPTAAARAEGGNERRRRPRSVDCGHLAKAAKRPDAPEDSCTTRFAQEAEESDNLWMPEKSAAGSPLQSARMLRGLRGEPPRPSQVQRSEAQSADSFETALREESHPNPVRRKAAGMNRVTQGRLPRLPRVKGSPHSSEGFEQEGTAEHSKASDAEAGSSRGSCFALRKLSSL